MPAVLPEPLRQRFNDIDDRLRRRSVLQSTLLLIVALLATAVLAIGADAIWSFPRGIRILLFVGWLALAIGVGHSLWQRRRIARRRELEIATAIEQHYPTLAERLITLSQLPEQTQEGHGSRALISHLGREADRRTQSIDRERIVPPRRTRIAAGLVAGLAILLVGSIPVIPGAARQTRRFVVPWYEPRVVLPYRIVATSGDPVIRRGDPVTLTAYAERHGPQSALPEAVWLIVRDLESPQERPIPMTGSDRGIYHVTRPRIAADFDYCIQSDGQRTEWNSVRVSDPVAWTAETTLRVQSPAYAQSTHPERTLPGFAALDALEHSQALLKLVFDRPPDQVQLEFKAGDGVTSPVTLTRTESPMHWTTSFRIAESGQLTLITTGAHGLKTSSVIAVRAVPDAPPQWTQLNGLGPRPLEVRPGEKIPIAVGVSDDVAVASVTLEYRVGESPPVKLSLPMQGLGSPLAEGRTFFDTQGKAKVGESIQLRITATDGRSVPDRGLAPQSITFPPNGWATIRLTHSARPLSEQQIYHQRDAIAESLKAALRKTADAQTEVGRIRQSTAQQSRLSDDQTVRLAAAKDQLGEALEHLKDAARQAEVIPELADLAKAIRSTAEGPLPAGADRLKKGMQESEASARNDHLQQSQNSLDEALRQIDEALEQNDALAKHRRDRKALDELASEQAELAQSQSLSSPEQIERQKALRDRLTQILRESDSLKNQWDQASRARAAELQKELAALQKERDALESQRQARQRELQQHRDASLAKKQSDVAAKAARLALEPSVRQFAGEPFDPKPSSLAAEKLKDGQTIEALTEQEKSARSLEQLAESLAAAADRRSDPKELARQIARWHEELGQRIQEFTRKQSYAQLPAHVRDALGKEYQFLRSAVEKIDVPENLKEARSKAIQLMETIQRELGQNRQPAAKTWEETTAALSKLSDQMPTRAQRLQATRNEVNKRIDEQAALLKQTQDALKLPNESDRARTLAGLAGKQSDLARQAAKLDTPGLDDRRSQIVAEAGTAANDLGKQRGADAVIAQQETKRQLERLRQAIDGHTPGDQAAQRLAQQQRQVADAAQKLTPDSPSAEFDRLQQLEREITRNLTPLNVPDAEALAQAAKDASRAAEQSLRRPMNQKPDVDELKKKTRDAAEALDRLADRLAGAESEASRVERLLRNRERAAERAPSLAGKPADPESARQAQRNVQNDLDELTQTRAGDAQGQKKRAQEALQRLKQTPDPDRQKALQQQATEALRDLHAQLKQDQDLNSANARPGPPPPDFSSADAPGLPTRDRAEAVRQLAREQKSLRDEVAQAATANRTESPELKAREEKLAAQSLSLSEKLKQTAESAGLSGSDPGKAASEALGQAAEHTGKAAREFERAVRESSANRADSATQAREAARASMARAAAALAKSPPPDPALPKDAATAQLPEASSQMSKAIGDLSAQRPNDARSAMERAADLLAGRNPGTSNPGGQPSQPPQGPQNDKSDTTTKPPAPLDLKALSAVPWGELPGEVRSRIIQELSAQYGEDYARSIKLYFEQLADRK